MNKLTRYVDIQLRSLEEQERTVEGIACVFDTETDLGYFYEKIDRHAFDGCDMSDVYCLFNHDENYPLARTLNNSLKLSVEDIGLRQVTNIIETSQGNDVFKMVREKLIDKMSFAFTIASDGDEWRVDENGKEHRTITKISKLYDVSLVTYPAYDSTSAFARSLDELDTMAKRHLEVKQMEEIKEAPQIEEVEEREAVATETIVEEKEVVEEATQEVTEEVTEEATEDVAQENQMEERQMNTDFQKVEARAEDVKAWRQSVMTMMAEERAGVKSTDAGVPVPQVFQGYVERVWDTIDLLDEVKTSTIKGILNVSYEELASPAQFHDEGTPAPEEEEIELGEITITPRMIKKWISVTDELEALTDDEFMKYIAEEVVQKVLELAQRAILIGARNDGKGVVGITNAELAEEFETKLDFNSINRALAFVEAGSNPLVVMNRKTFFDNVMGLTDTTGRPIYQIATDNTGKPQYFINGIRVKFNNAIGAYNESSADPWAIVGDFKAYRLNMPMGKAVKTLFDPYTLATEDKSRMIGKLFVGGNVTKPGALVWLHASSAV